MLCLKLKREVCVIYFKQSLRLNLFNLNGCRSPHQLIAEQTLVIQVLYSAPYILKIHVSARRERRQMQITLHSDKSVMLPVIFMDVHRLKILPGLHDKVILISPFGNIEMPRIKANPYMLIVDRLAEP